MGILGAIFPPNTVAEVAFASALARASMESEHYVFVMEAAYVPHEDSFAASKAGKDIILIKKIKLLAESSVPPLKLDN